MMQWCPVHSHPCAAFTFNKSRAISAPKRETLCPPVLTAPFLRFRPLAPTSQLSVSTLDISHKRNHTNVAFYVWLLSLTVTFLRFIYANICMSTSCLLMAEYYSSVDISQCVYPLIHWWIFALFSLFSVKSICVKMLYMNTCFHSFR